MSEATGTNDEGWRRLARVVEARRNRLGLTQEDVAGRDGPSTATLRLIEGALQDSYRSKTLFSLDRALGWPHGASIDVVEGRVSALTFQSFDEWLEDLINDVRSEVLDRRDFVVKPSGRSRHDVGSDEDDAAELRQRIERARISERTKRLLLAGLDTEPDSIDRGA